MNRFSKSVFNFRRKYFNRNEYPLEKKYNPQGINDKRVIYIIRRISDSGFFSNVFYVLGHICYANEMGYLPVVDMENYKTLYNEECNVDETKNAWEYYFYQPVDLSLEEAYNSKQIVLSDNLYLRNYVPLYVGNYSERGISKSDVENLNKICKKYIRIKKDILHKNDRIWKDLIRTSGNVLGVHIRGTDMKCFPNHPNPPELDKYLDIIDGLLKNEKYKIILLCTDEEKIANTLRGKYPKQIITTDAYRAIEENSNGVHFSDDSRELHKYKLGLEVLRDAYFLSKCDGLVYSNSNVPYFAAVINGNKYKDIIFVSGK